VFTRKKWLVQLDMTVCGIASSFKATVSAGPCPFASSADGSIGFLNPFRVTRKETDIRSTKLVPINARTQRLSRPLSVGASDTALRLTASWQSTAGQIGFDDYFRASAAVATRNRKKRAEAARFRKADDQLRFAVSPLHCSIFSTRQDVVPMAYTFPSGPRMRPSALQFGFQRGLHVPPCVIEILPRLRRARTEHANRGW